MKWFVAVLLFLWLLCGFAGSWRMEGLDNLHLKTIALGPISLVQAFNEDPVDYPGP